jgi:DNA-binding transcriptional MerR regulator
MIEQGYRAPEAQRIAGITYRQLDYWTRTALVTPSVKDAHGSGSQRLFSFQDLATLKVIKRLLDTGLTLQQVRKAVNHLATMKKRPYGVTLMSDGKGVYEAHSPEAVVDLLKNGQGVFAISLDAVWDDLESDVAAAGGARRNRAASGGS